MPSTLEGSCIIEVCFEVERQGLLEKGIYYASLC